MADKLIDEFRQIARENREIAKVRVELLRLFARGDRHLRVDCAADMEAAVRRFLANEGLTITAERLATRPRGLHGFTVYVDEQKLLNT